MSEASALRVFISYARRDCSEFAEELLAGLEVAGFDPFLDKHDIAAGEDWEARLGGLISAADTVVFVISPASVTSDRCAWEVAKAEEFSKRIIPIVALPVSEAETPHGLKRLNYIFFSEGSSFARSLGDLARALRIDVDWIREHTRLAELAARWRGRNNAEVLLLRGSELEAAKAWLNGWKAGAPEPSDLHRAFIGESDVAENNALIAERKRLEQLSRRTTIGLIAAGTLTAGAGGLAYWANDAENRFNREKARAAAAEAGSIAASVRREAVRTDIVGQLSAYAAAPGQLAMDQGDETPDNSPFTYAVIQELANPDTSFQAALARSYSRVNQATGRRQRPYLSTDLNGDLYLRRRSPTRRIKAITLFADRAGGVPLRNPGRDAALWTALFREVGFETNALQAATRAEFVAASATLEFPSAPPAPAPSGRRSERAEELIQNAGLTRARGGGSGPPDTLVLLFYSGVGLSVEGRDYLCLNETRVDSPQAIRLTAIDLLGLQDALREVAAASVLILDTNFSLRGFDSIR